MSLLLQSVVVALLVIGSTGYAAWTLMPAGARRALAGRLLKLSFLPVGLADRLRPASLARAGCGCDGCDRAPGKPRGKQNTTSTSPVALRQPPIAQPITLHPRIRR